MFTPVSRLTPRAARAILLVLLPLVLADGQERPAILAALRVFQQQLGAAIRVLVVDQATHPSVVSSFDGRGLPAFVLMQHGLELWRQQGLPEGEAVAALLLSKLAPPL